MCLSGSVKMKKIVTLMSMAVGLSLLPLAVFAYELSGYSAVEGRYFLHDSPFATPKQADASIVLAPEFYHEWNAGDYSLLFSPFLRVDSADSARTHADIRELIWQTNHDDWELKLGVGKVFWGVTESQHLVDVINQTDLVENADTEDKLGQPMINLTLLKDWGTVDLFVLPYFRERTFAGKAGRLRSTVVVDTDNARYESGAAERHIDAAIRWSHSVGDWDLGVSHFYGTNRDPQFQFNPLNNTLTPYYDIIHQTGLDIQNTTDSWLWKLELIRRDSKTDTFTALTGGLEYTFYDVAATGIDVGVIGEYLFDDRHNVQLTPFQNDMMIGTRLAWNDVQSSELLFGVIQDLDTDDRMWTIEASRRLGDRWKASLEARFFSISTPSSALYSVREDSYIQIELSRYF